MLLPDPADALALTASTLSDPDATLTRPASILPDHDDTLGRPAQTKSWKPRVFPVSFPDNGSFLETGAASHALERVMEHAVESEELEARAPSRRHVQRVTTLIPTSSATAATALLLVQLYLGAGSLG